MILRALAAIGTVVAVVVFGAMLFAAAGTLDWTGAWIWLAITVVAGALMSLTIDPGLIKERLTGIAAAPRQRTAADMWGIVTALLFFPWLLLIALDAARYGWSSPPGWTQLVGGAVFVAANGLVGWALRANRFASSAVRIQDERGQSVVSSGPYAFVRHPMYSAMLVYLPGTALLLGSLYGLVLCAPLVLTLAMRTWHEDRMLTQQLSGYRDYARRVRYRLVPGVW